MEDNDLFASLLRDPEALQGALAAAASLLGGSAPASTSITAPSADPASAPPAPRTAPGDAADPSADLMHTVMPVIASLARSGQQAVDPQKRDLLRALKPFVGVQAARQIDHGLKLVTLARMAETAMGQLSRTVQPTEEAGHV